MSKSNYLETAVLNHVFRTATLTKPATVYVALYTAAPGEAGGGTEVTGGSYARAAVASGDASWSAPADNAGSQQIANAAPVTFPDATADWGTVTHVGLFDASSGGNLLYSGALTTAQTITAGAAVSFAAGVLAVSED